MELKPENRLIILEKKSELLFTRLQDMYDTGKKAEKDKKLISAFLSKSRHREIVRREFIETIDAINEISFLVKDNFKPSYRRVESFEEIFCLVNEYFSNFEEKKASEVNATKAGTSSQPSNSKLHPINLPNFGGSLEDWPLFYQLFKKMVHENNAYTDVEKVAYLVNHLKGSALSICTSIPPTAENYDLMMNALKNRYEDRHAIVRLYLDKILNFKPLSVESDQSLDSFLSNFVEPVNALKQMNFKDLADILFLHLGIKKLDPCTAKLFEYENRLCADIPKFDDLVKFVNEQAKILSRSHISSKSVNKMQFQNSNKSNNASKNSNSFNYALLSHDDSRKNLTRNCNLCSLSLHPLYQCNTFKDMNVNDRWSYARGNRICFQCLSPFHLNSSCRSTTGCHVRNCNKKHHTLLHQQLNSQVSNSLRPSEVNLENNSTEVKSESSIENSKPSISFCSTDTSGNQSVILLATVTVLVKDGQGRTHELRGILDGGSQSNFITRDACRRLSIQTEPIQSVVKGIGADSLNISACALLEFYSKFDLSNAYAVHALVIDKLSDSIPTSTVSTESLEHLSGLPLADSKFYEPRKVDLLIGAELWPLICGTNKIEGKENSPVALETTLGYVVMGRTSVQTHRSSNICFFAEHALTHSLDGLLQKFWDLEEIPRTKVLSAEEEQCEILFQNNWTRNEDGSFTVRLPFCRSPEILGSSLQTSIAKFLSLEKRISKDHNIYQLYKNVIEDYERENIVSKVGRLFEVKNHIAYYMPFHGIYRPDHPTTRLRIVFNASAPTTSSYSLNDLLHVGPKLHTDIFEVLIRFRLFPFAFTADLKQMFLQIWIQKEDRRYQRFIWRNDQSSDLEVYEVNKVVFGSRSSPYLANRIVKLLATLERDRFPLAASVAEEDLYVDDIVRSVETESELFEMHKQLNAMFESGHFPVSKWASNSVVFMEKIPRECRLLSDVDFEQDIPSKVLGVQWSSLGDCFSIVVNTPQISCSKRNILAVTARIFDPLGLVAPVTLFAKLIMKELWEQRIGWDDIPPSSILKKWNQFMHTLPDLKKFSINRYIGMGKCVNSTLIGFADSSIKAYGGCVYVRTETSDGKVKISLLCAKSKVAPTKMITIPRLELCAAMLLSKLMRTVLDSFASRCKFSSVFAFTDSKVVLHWIKSDPSKWKTFVSNRLVKIQESLSPDHWHHVSGVSNPADVLSRGTTAPELLTHPLWSNGPTWLIDNFGEWPIEAVKDPVEMPEIEERSISLLSTDTQYFVLTPLLDRVSSFRKLLRTTAFIFRVCKRNIVKLPYITTEELENATRYWIRYVQSCHFRVELNRLEKGLPINTNLKHFDIFLDNGIIRIGGRLQNAKLKYDQKHPILLPSKGKFVDLVIDQYHSDLLHAGSHIVLSIIRLKYWILSASKRIRSRIRKCNTCYRTKPKPIFPKMAPLPEFRVNEARAFDRTGVDYAGPFHITMFRRRGQPCLTKAYFCLFICLTTKAIHIELASDLSSDCFLAAYKRFISRRGPCTLILSDGGSNFIGARRKLGELERLVTSSTFQKDIGTEMSNRGIHWKINPAYGPWFGGIWEANIKSVKSHLNKLIGKQILTYEEFNTVLVQIEALMNSRPLCVLSADPNSPAALTPAHFLTVGTTLQNLSSEDVRGAPINRLNRYQLIDRIVQDYWERWRLEYLHTLQSRAKWTRERPGLSEGTVVVLVQDNIPPLKWPLGIVDKIIPGNDGIVRVVDVRTNSGVFRRPVGKLCPLPSQ